MLRRHMHGYPHDAEDEEFGRGGTLKEVVLTTQCSTFRRIVHGGLLQASLLKLAVLFFAAVMFAASLLLLTSRLKVLCAGPIIPHTILFTQSHDILETKSPLEIYRNIQNTIDLYRKAWGQPDAEVKFLLDDDCRRVIHKVYPDLLIHFNNETIGMFRADLCRVAALYDQGGYYFDGDVEVLRAFVPNDAVEFATVESPWFVMVENRNASGLFFQAFLASKRKSRILKETLKVMHDWYTGKIKPPTDDPMAMMGITTLRYAYDNIASHSRGELHLLKEDHLDAVHDLYPDFPRQEGRGCCCNWVVHDPNERKVHFYSRLLTKIVSKCSESSSVATVAGASPGTHDVVIALRERLAGHTGFFAI